VERFQARKPLKLYIGGTLFPRNPLGIFLKKKKRRRSAAFSF